MTNDQMENTEEDCEIILKRILQKKMPRKLK